MVSARFAKPRHCQAALRASAWSIGAQHVEAVERGFYGDRGVTAREARRVIREWRCGSASRPYGAPVSPDCEADLVGPAQRRRWRAMRA